MNLARIPGPIGSLFRGRPQRYQMVLGGLIGVQTYSTFREEDHPRADDGRFGDKPGDGKAEGAKPKAERKAKPATDGGPWVSGGESTAHLPPESPAHLEGHAPAFERVMGKGEYVERRVGELLKAAGKQGLRMRDLVRQINGQGTVYGDVTPNEIKFVLDVLEVHYRGDKVALSEHVSGATHYHAPLGGILGVQRYATDAQGHEHVESGPKGGQFTSKGGGGDKDPGEHTPGDSSGEAKPKPEADKPETPRSHRDAYRDLIAKAKETRRAAWTEARAKAKESDTAANQAAADALSINNDLRWLSDDDAFDAYRELDELISEFDPDWSVEDRMTVFKQIGDVAKTALKVEADDSDDPDAMTAEDIAANRPKLKAIIAQTKAGRDHLRAYVAARREVQAIKSGKWQQYAAVLGGLGVAAYGTDDLGNEHVDSGPQGGQFTSKGGGGGKKGKAKPNPKAKAAEPGGHGTAGAGHPLGKDHAAVRQGLKKEAAALREGAGDTRGYEKAKPTAAVLDKVEAAVKPVVAEAAKTTTVGLPIADVYDKVKDEIGGMSPHAFHAALFHLWDAGRVRLSGWSKTVDEMPRPEHAMPVGSRHMYYIQPG